MTDITIIGKYINKDKLGFTVDLESGEVCYIRAEERILKELTDSLFGKSFKIKAHLCWGDVVADKVFIML